jgi:S1-C subfamily serine protease
MRYLIGVLAALAVAGPGQAEPGPDAPVQAVVAPLPAGTVARPVAITRLATDLRPDQQIGTALYGVICVERAPVTWKMLAPQFSNLRSVFGEELKAAGFTPETNPGDLFAAKEEKTTDLEVGARVKSADAHYCENITGLKGRLTLDIQWQVYSNLRREVVATVETHATAEKSKGLLASHDEARSLAQDAFAANVRALLADPQFRRIVTAPEAGVPGPAQGLAGREPIHLVGAPGRAVAISDAVGSVASIFAGDGFGSGVLVSSDGYMLTDAHVVGTSAHVRVRWSDGFETTGEVVRSDKRRDVALIKTDTHGRAPLALRRGSPNIGATVFAIGTPLDPKLQSTVTRGVVSANRIVDGFSFIQSDVPVNHGNSGGPLVDESGAVIGLTDWGMQPEGDNSHNFFTPIGDALDFLGLKTDEAAAPAPATTPSPPRSPRPRRGR